MRGTSNDVSNVVLFLHCQQMSFLMLQMSFFPPRVNNSNVTLFWFSLKQAFEVDKPLGDATRDADFTMEVVTLLKI